MYYLFKFHHITPSQFMAMGYGEKQILSAFIHREIDEKNEETKLLSERGLM